MRATTGGNGAMDVSASHMEQEGSGSSEARQWSWDRGQPAHAFPMVRGRERLPLLSQFRERRMESAKDGTVTLEEMQDFMRGTSRPAPQH
jgi:hypothetical protein